MKRPLTTAQVVVLRELAKPGVNAIGGIGHEWTVSGRPCFGTLKKLVAAGMIHHSAPFTGTVSESGRAYLAALDAQEPSHE